MSYPNKVEDAELGTLTVISALPSLPKFPTSEPPKLSVEEKSITLPYNEFLIPRKAPAASGGRGVPKPNMKSGKHQKRITRWKAFQLWYNTYRKFFTVAVTLNAIGVLLAGLDIWHYPRLRTGAMVLGNLHVGILVRNELFQRGLYLFANTFFAKWAPLRIRLGWTSVLQHLGGIHSGCCSSGFAWLIFRLVLIFMDYRDNNVAVLTMGVLTGIALAISIVSGTPWVRNTHHNVFERHHRFSGWTGVIFTWIFVVLGDCYDTTTHAWDIKASTVIRQQEVWYILAITAFIAWPWMTIREVPVDIEIPSPKVAVLRFERGMQQGLLARVSRSSIMEYHAFGIISEGTHAKYHYLIVGVQGDFTKSLVDDPPTHIWTRQLKFAGISNTSTLYKRGIRVCTGTGLGASLSTCIQNPNWYLIWVGSDQAKTFGPTISSLIYQNIEPERMCLWDSRERGGRPDVVPLVIKAFHDWNAEVVFITSNFQGNQELMEGLKQAGVPAFGTLWDF